MCQQNTYCLKSPDKVKPFEQKNTEGILSYIRLLSTCKVSVFQKRSFKFFFSEESYLKWHQNFAEFQMHRFQPGWIQLLNYELR